MVAVADGSSVSVAVEVGDTVNVIEGSVVAGAGEGDSVDVETGVCDGVGVDVTVADVVAAGTKFGKPSFPIKPIPRNTMISNITPPN